MPARLILATAGSYGDLFPTLAVARGLAARGHSPVVATSPCYRTLVENDQLAFAPIRPDLNPFDPVILTRAMDPKRGSEVVVRELVMPALRASYDDLAGLVPGADLLVSHPITFAAPLAAEKVGLPWLSSVLAPLSFFSLTDYPTVPPVVALAGLTRASPVMARAVRAASKLATRRWLAPVAALRRDLGLPASGHPLFEGQFSPRGTLALFSSVLGAPQADWPAQTTVTGFAFYDGHGSLTPALARFLDAGDPPIVFTLGSSAVGAAGSGAFYEASLEAARTISRRAVLLVGSGSAWSGRAAEEDWMAVDYAPHHLIFPRAAAIVHHGGVGTTGQALRSGRPALVVPHAHDQFDNAERVVRAGTARSLDAREYTADAAASALHKLLSTAAIAEAATRVGVVVRGEDGVTTACRAIEAALGSAR